MLPETIYNTSITLTLKSKTSHKKAKLQANIPDEYRCKYPQQNISKLKSTIVQLPSCVLLWDPMAWITPSLPVPHHLLRFSQVHIHCISDVTQPSLCISLHFCFVFHYKTKIFSQWGTKGLKLQKEKTCFIILRGQED